MKYLVLIVAGLALTACSSLDTLLSNVDKPTATVANVSLTDLATDGLTLNINVDVNNPYDVPIPLTNIDYGLASNGTPFLTGESPLAGTIPARGQRTVTLPARIRFDELLRILNRIRPGQTVPYDAQLGLTVGTPVHENGMRLPISTAGEFPIPDIPRISVDSVAFSELNLSQAVATLRLRVTNTNQFPVALDEMLTNLSLNGRDLATTDLGRAVEFEPNGTQIIEFPITFSPLDAGVGLFDALRRPGTTYQTTGTLTLLTPFGPISMDY